MGLAYSLINPKMKLNNNWLVILLLIVAFLVRLFPLNFPAFTSDEARIAFRGYTLIRFGTDELGRKYPLIFNSLDDYQLPLTSYITSIGVAFFGKTDLGVRLPFILIGTLTIWLVYVISSLFFSHKFSLLSMLIASFSPPLIFLSKFPNDLIILVFLLLILFLNLTKKYVNLLITSITVVLLLSLSKFSWFIIVPYVAFTLFFYQDNLTKSKKLAIVAFFLLLNFLIIFLFLRIPQSVRSFSENNFLLFSDISIKNGIDKLRGQGIQSGWSVFLEKILFNKSHFLFVGFLHWLSNIQPAVFFAQFDKNGQFGFVSMGAWSKILIIPFLAALINIIKKNGNRKLKFLLGYFIILTYPVFFAYPKNLSNVTILILPFMAILIAWGFFSLKNWVSKLIILLMILEVVINLSYLNTQIKNTNDLRPLWIKEIVLDGFKASEKNKVAFSDDITSDIVPFLQWYALHTSTGSSFNLTFPYKFRQTQISDIKIIGSEENFYNCGLDRPTYIFASKRDLKKIHKAEKINVNKVYEDSLRSEVVYLLPPIICVK